MVLTSGLLSFLAGLTFLQLSASSAQDIAVERNDLLVPSTSGLVQGFLDINITSAPLNKWLGIRYAADTSGKNRWRPPQSVVIQGIFNARAYGPACLQGR